MIGEILFWLIIAAILSGSAMGSVVVWRGVFRK